MTKIGSKPSGPFQDRQDFFLQSPLSFQNCQTRRDQNFQDHHDL